MVYYFLSSQAKYVFSFFKYESHIWVSWVVKCDQSDFGLLLFMDFKKSQSCLCLGLLCMLFLVGPVGIFFYGYVHTHAYMHACNTCIYIHTYIHTYTHPNVHIYISAYIYIFTYHIYIHTCYTYIFSHLSMAVEYLIWANFGRIT